jgi:LysR family transcriptional regulator for bpeEF and oprC
MSQLEGIEYFVRTVEAGSFAAAARRLGVTPSAVSRQVARLEAELGVPLLARTTRSLSLTHDGQAFHARCLRVLEELTEARDALARVRKQPAGVLRVDAPVALGRKLFAPRLPEFLERYPDIDVELTLRDQLIDPFVEGSDVLVRIGARRDSPLIARGLGESRLVMCGAPSYLRKHGTPDRPADLARHQCLSYLRPDGRQSWRLRSGQQLLEIVPLGNLQVNDADVLVTHALAGRGLVVVFDFLVADAIARGQLVAVLEPYAPPPWPIHALYPRNRHLVPKVGAFLDFLGEVFGGATRRSPGARRLTGRGSGRTAASGSSTADG